MLAWNQIWYHQSNVGISVNFTFIGIFAVSTDFSSKKVNSIIEFNSTNERTFSNELKFEAEMSKKHCCRKNQNIFVLLSQKYDYLCAQLSLENPKIWALLAQKWQHTSTLVERKNTSQNCNFFPQNSLIPVILNLFCK